MVLEVCNALGYISAMIDLPTLVRPGAGVISTTDDPEEGPGSIPLHGPEGFAGMRRAGRLAASLLDELTRIALPEVTTEAIDDFAYTYMRDNGAFPATMFYRGYQKNVCTSVNHVVCHGIPGPKRLKDGDIVNIDVTCVLDGWYGDCSRMYLIGDVPLRARRLVDTTYEAMMRGIAAAKPGNTLGDVGYAIQSFAEGLRYSVVRDFCGHGLGRKFHTAPSVVHIGRPGKGLVLRPGMFFTIEPMINIGRADVKVLEDGWTAVTRDRSLSAQFEHSIGITTDGCEIFTTSPAGLHQPPYTA
jgi:methionyl aminopeptidase